MTDKTAPQTLSHDEMEAIVRNPYQAAGFPELYVAAPTPLLEDAMRFIEEHPERHQQGMWMARYSDLDETPDDVPICGTAGCLAGWGIALNSPIEGQRIVTGTGRVILAHQDRHAAVPDYAAYLFGITTPQARVLFEGHWGSRALRRGVDAIKADPHIGPESLDRAMSD